MPVGRGFMVFDRILPVTVVVTNTGYFCNQSLYDLNATVNIPSATGTVSFYAWTSNTASTLLGAATLSSGSADYDMAGNTLTTGTYYLQAVYSGDGGHLPSSSPPGLAGYEVIAINADGTTMSQPALTAYTPVGSAFCKADSTTFTATITADHLANPSDGTVAWQAYLVGGSTISLGTSAVTTGGLTMIVVPANTFTSNGTWQVSGGYSPGLDGCYYYSSESPTLSVVAASATSSTVITPIGSFCVYSNENFTVTVTSTTGGVANPTSGLVTIYATGDSGPYSLGSASLSGSNSVSVPCNDGGLSWNWPGIGTNPIYAVYAGDGACVGGSTSANINITTFINNVSMFAPNGPTLICNGDGSNVTFTVYIFASTSGTISGTMGLYSNEVSGALSSQVISVPYSGQTITFTFSDSAFTTLGVQNVYANFQPNTTAGCYGGGNSPLSSNITVVNSSSQNAGIAQVASEVSGFSYGSGSTAEIFQETSGGNADLYFLADVTRTGGQAGTTSGTVYWYISNSPTNVTTSGIFFTNVFFTDSGTSTITPQATLPAGLTTTYFGSEGFGDFYIQAQYEGNGCFSAANSNVIHLNVTEKIA